ncbi:hypothetical protein GNX18_14670 [Microbulbifer sp. SH-1]|uniref:hypothetical protein n=1 Tax=Microbulbifer sp. SH-1 TaxID=2681547 RepID=UPI00140C8B78|nr:hypothetical protein [Microbulbifer sp. SH-1]QIL90875.1 hypothetical protein GNX18_14670 [Microbulbifer sp. SH-1]
MKTDTMNNHSINQSRIYRSALTLCCGIFCGFATAETKTDFSFEAGAGMEHDSNLSIQELDRTQDSGDSAFLLHADARGKVDLNEALTIKAGYRHQWKNYQTFADFDQRTGTWSLDASYDFSALTLGASLYRANATLDDSPLLTLTLGSVYAGRLIGERVYLRGAFGQRDKDFSGNPLRDALADVVDSDMFVFFAGARSFISLGASWENEDAVSDSLDYRGRSLRARLSHKFTLVDFDNTLQLGWRFDRRNYASEFSAVDTPLDTSLLPGQDDALPPAPSDKRRDFRRTLEASWELAMTPSLSLTGKVSRGNHSSPVAGADYEETLASLMLSASF